MESREINYAQTLKKPYIYKKNYLQSKIFYAILSKLSIRQENRGVTVGHVLK